MADGDSSLEAPECHFWKMPQEVQDMIFELAYGIKSHYQPVQKPPPARPRRNWGEDIETDIEKPFTPKVEEFLICKTWLLCAAAAWIQAQSVLPPLYSNRTFLSTGLIAAFTRHIDLSSYTGAFDLKILRAYRNLCYLRICLGVDDFRAESRCPWTCKLDSGDFQCIRFVQQLIAIRGLTDFELSESSYHLQGTRTQDERTAWKENLESFESYVKSFVLLPKDKSYVHSNTIVKSGPMPLYLGSRVCHETSKLLPVNYYKRYGQLFEIASDFIESQSWENMHKLTSSPIVEELDAKTALPKSGDELVQMLGMTPGQLWKYVQKAKKSGLALDL